MEILRRILHILFGSVLGISMIAVGVWNYQNNIDETKGYTIPIEATISNITESSYYDYHNHEERYNYKIYVDYTFDNNNYKNKEINLNSNLYKIGDKIKIKINPDNPSNPIYIEQKLLSIIIIVIGVILLIAGVMFSIAIW